MYKVIGTYQNAGKNGSIHYHEQLLKECDTLEDAEFYAKRQKGAWDKIIIRDNDDNDVN